MSYSDKLRTAIQEKNVIHARTAILSYLDSDATMAIPQAYSIAVEIADNFTDPEDPFFDKENNLLVIPPKQEWDSSLLRKIKAALQTNFSKEKLELAEQIIFNLRARGMREFQVASTVHRQGETVRPRVNSIPEKKNTQHYVHPEYPTPTVSAERRKRPQYRKSPKQTQSEFLAGAIGGGVALG